MYVPVAFYNMEYKDNNNPQSRQNLTGMGMKELRVLGIPLDPTDFF